MYCDACLEGMGFWYPFITEPMAFYSPVPFGIPSQHIFYYKALCALSTLFHGSHLLPARSQILIFTNNINTVDIFSTLHALPTYNSILKLAVDVLLKFDHKLRVRCVPSNQNGVANSISCHQFVQALTICPNLHISSFEPPHLLLGEPKK